MEEHYGPEDIEQLLLDKEFSELLPEEKTYVLKHIKGEQEYESMRDMLLEIKLSSDDFVAPERMRDELIAAHEGYHKRPSIRVWLNTLFSSLSFESKSLRPALQLAGIAALIVGSVWIFKPFDRDISDEKLVLGPELIENPMIPDEPKIQEKAESVQENTTLQDHLIEQDISAQSSEVPSADASDLNVKKQELKAESSSAILSNSDIPEDELEVIEKGNEEMEQLTMDSSVDESIEKEFDDTSIISEEFLNYPAQITTRTLEVIEEKIPASSKSTRSRARSDEDSLMELEISLERSAIDPDIIKLLYTAW